MIYLSKIYLAKFILLHGYLIPESTFIANEYQLTRSGEQFTMSNAQEQIYHSRESLFSVKDIVYSNNIPIIFKQSFRLCWSFTLL